MGDLVCFSRPCDVAAFVIADFLSFFESLRPCPNDRDKCNYRVCDELILFDVHCVALTVKVKARNLIDIM